MPSHRQIVRLLLLIDDATNAAVMANPNTRTVTLTPASIKAALGRAVPERIVEMLVQLMDNGQVASWRKGKENAWVVHPSAKLLRENREIALAKTPFARGYRSALLIRDDIQVALQLRIAVIVHRETGAEEPAPSTLRRVADQHPQRLTWVTRSQANSQPPIHEMWILPTSTSTTAA